MGERGSVELVDVTKRFGGVVRVTIPADTAAWVKRLVPTDRAMHFIELQFHRQLTLADVEGID